MPDLRVPATENAVRVSLGFVLLAVAACSAASSDPAGPTTAPPPVDTTTGGDAGPATGLDLFDQPLTGITADDLVTFHEGDALFEVPLRDADGLGPVYTRNSCGGCHASGVRGPGSVQKMAVVDVDGVTPSGDQATLLPYGQTVRPLLTAGATKAVLPPNDPRVKVTVRVGPPILGRGYIEAVADAEIERMAAEQATRTDGIHGRVNHVTYASEISADARFHHHVKGDAVIGRFGLKARIGFLDDFAADAFQGDMGITSPLRPVEVPNPDSLTDDLKAGVDVEMASVQKRAMYMRLTAIPKRRDDAAGLALFQQTNCSVCHAPSLATRADYPIALLANVQAPIFTDLLVHDMGTGLADGVVDGEAGSTSWRTAPLIGLRFERTFMHDSRATTIRQAIELHGGEAADSVNRYHALSANDRDLLEAFVGGL